MALASNVSTINRSGTGEDRLRAELSDALRLAAKFDLHEAVANHFSVAASEDGRRFLMNPRWRHFSQVRAADLLLLDVDDPAAMDGPDAPDPSAWCIHSRLHADVPEARCVLHVHSPYATVLACLEDPTLLPIDQNCARYFNRVAYDPTYGGIADNDSEARHIVAAIGDRRRLLLANHGVIVVAPTVAEAFDDLYYLERACRTLVLAYSTGQKLRVLSDAIAEKTARDWEDYGDAATAHFDELRRTLAA